MKNVLNAVRAAIALAMFSAMSTAPVSAAPFKPEDAWARAVANAKEAFAEVKAKQRENAGVKAADGNDAASKVGGKVSGKSRYDRLIAQYASAEGVPLALAHAVIRIESNYRANARGSAGEIGLMQIKPSTARGMGFRGSVKALYDPATNLRWGMKYLGRANKLGGGDTCGAVLRYNAGHGAKRMNKASAAYCSRVKKAMKRA